MEWVIFARSRCCVNMPGHALVPTTANVGRQQNIPRFDDDVPFLQTLISLLTGISIISRVCIIYVVFRRQVNHTRPRAPLLN